MRLGAKLSRFDRLSAIFKTREVSCKNKGISLGKYQVAYLARRLEIPQSGVKSRR